MKDSFQNPNWNDHVKEPYEGKARLFLVSKLIAVWRICPRSCLKNLCIPPLPLLSHISRSNLCTSLSYMLYWRRLLLTLPSWMLCIPSLHLLFQHLDQGSLLSYIPYWWSLCSLCLPGCSAFLPSIWCLKYLDQGSAFRCPIPWWILTLIKALLDMLSWMLYAGSVLFGFLGAVQFSLQLAVSNALWSRLCSIIRPKCHINMALLT